MSDFYIFQVLVSLSIYMGWIYFFNGISTFVGYLTPKLFLSKDSRANMQPFTCGIKGVTFPKGIGPKVNVIAQLEFEPAYFKVVV